MLNTMASSRSEVEDIGRSLLKTGIKRIFTGHRTGPKGYEALKGVLGEHLELLPTGRCVEI